MTEQDLSELVKQTLYDVAPELEGEEVMPDETFADQFDIDSMDFLNFVIGLNKSTGVEIPETDYPEIATLSGCVAYLKSHMAS